MIYKERDRAPFLYLDSISFQTWQLRVKQQHLWAKDSVIHTTNSPTKCHQANNKP